MENRDVRLRITQQGEHFYKLGIGGLETGRELERTFTQPLRTRASLQALKANPQGLGGRDLIPCLPL